MTDQKPAPTPEKTEATCATVDLVAHLRRQHDWSERTFGPGPRTAGVIDHIKKELKEIEEAPLDLSEWVDVAILALDGAWRAGHSPEQIAAAILVKQERNEKRTWPDWRTMPTDKAIEHDRSNEPTQPTPSEPRPDATAATERYWLRMTALPWSEVTKERFMQAEQDAGFRSKFGPGHLATSGFGGSGVEGTITWGLTTPDTRTQPEPAPAPTPRPKKATCPCRDYEDVPHALNCPERIITDDEIERGFVWRLTPEWLKDGIKRRLAADARLLKDREAEIERLHHAFKGDTGEGVATLIVNVERFWTDENKRSLASRLGEKLAEEVSRLEEQVSRLEHAATYKINVGLRAELASAAETIRGLAQERDDIKTVFLALEQVCVRHEKANSQLTDEVARLRLRIDEKSKQTERPMNGEVETELREENARLLARVAELEHKERNARSCPRCVADAGTSRHRRCGLGQCGCYCMSLDATTAKYLAEDAARFEGKDKP